MAKKTDLHNLLKAELSGSGVSSDHIGGNGGNSDTINYGVGEEHFAQHDSGVSGSVEPVSAHFDNLISPSGIDAKYQNTPRFIHLHAQSAYSLLESALPLATLIDLAVADHQPALAVTDRNNLFGALEFSEKAAGKGLQPIMGSKLSVHLGELAASDSPDDNNRNSGSKRPYFEELPVLVLLAMNETGYANLVKLGSIAHIGQGEPIDEPNSPVEAFLGADVPEKSEPKILGRQWPVQGAKNSDAAPNSSPLGPHITLANLATFNEGLICLTASSEGPVNMALAEGNKSLARQRLERLSEYFPDRLYVELQRHGSRDDPRELTVEGPLLELAYDLQLPIVATNQPYFPAREDFDAHDALVCIADGVVVASDDRRHYTQEHYFKSQLEMAALFADLPEALENTIEIAMRCSFRSRKRDPILPMFAKVEGNVGSSMLDKTAIVRAEATLLRSQAESGLKERLSFFEPATGFTREDYVKRLDYELGIIEQMGFPGYFLIVADFIKWAKDHDIPVGPGRGSGAGSLVAWVLTITDIDPMRFSLLFERFLNPERVSMPDFDIDFCQDRREEVIRYVQQKYGREQVAQIITFGSLQARAVLRDVGRVLQMPYGQVDRIAKLIPANPANPVTLKQALEMEPRLQEARSAEPIVGKLFDIATKLEGLYRHASTHAAGIVIGDRKLDELVPLYRDPRSDMPVTQFNMKWVEPAGLVKFDFLGLKTLTVLEKAIEFVAKREENANKIELLAIPLDDPETFAMLTRGETVGVFQLESMGMRKALIGMRPDRFEDIIALVALYRPGPMENIPVYNARKNGEEKIESIHPVIDHLVAETQGVIVYQEQVMQIAQELAGYSLGEADLLRRAMGKKIRSEMDKQRGVFVNGAVERGLTKPRANDIFDLLAKFADYGFNKSHAAAYALVSYQTAYMKARYPVEFLAASMQLDMGNTDKLAIFRQEAEGQGIKVLPPSVQTSKIGFSVNSTSIFYALAAIKGVGGGAVSQIVSEREENGPYKNLQDFFNRIDIRQVNKRTLENLICAGALDCFGHPREQLLAGLDRLTGHASRMAQDRATGQNDMFGTSSATAEKIELPIIKPWLPSEKLQREFSAMGFYLSAHPLDEYREMMQKIRVQLFNAFETSVRGGASAGRLAGTVTGKQERKTRTGKRMGIITLSDPSGQYEAVIFEEGLDRFRDLLEPGKSVIILAGAEMREEGISIRIQSVELLDAQILSRNKNLRVYLRDPQPIAGISSMLGSNRSVQRGDGRVSLIVIQDNGSMEVELMLREKFQFNPSIANAIKSIPGVLEVELG